MSELIGRKRELEVLRDCAAAERSQLVVVYGRRRVGKTFLVREAFDYKFTFTHTGIEKGSFREQLAGFASSLREQFDVDFKCPSGWIEAFDLLKKCLNGSGDQCKTVFIDELPWMDTPRSGFVKAVENFWNGWATARKDILLIVCGSAASWMTRKILQNRGGLFNRANRTIYLAPFTLRECEELVEAEGIVMDRKDIVSAYMILGGSPYYWTLLDRRESLSQNIDRLFFAENAELRFEFQRLYKSIFENPENYMAIVTALATKKAGMTREELAASASGIGNNGILTTCLENLEISGFIRRYSATGKKHNGSIFQLIDNFTLFYFRFISGYAGHDLHRWTHLLNDQSRVVWEGLAFERVCLLHVEQIKRALGISGVETSQSSWQCRSSEGAAKGAQIDLVIERADRVTNICEMKYSSSAYVIEADEAERLREKVAAFKRESGTRNNCHLTFVTTYGVYKGKNSSLIQSEVVMDDLFSDE